MSAIKSVALCGSAILVVALAIACGGGSSTDSSPPVPPDASVNFDPTQGQGNSGKLGFSTTDPNISALGVDTVKLTVTGADLTSPLTADGTVAGDTAKGVVANVPVGSDRTLNVKLLHGASLVAESTSANIMIVGGAETTVHPNFNFPSSVVINEIASGPTGAYMEIFNKGSTSVNLQGWKFNLTGFNPTNPTFNVTGEYTFKDVTIPAGGYLVVNGGTGTDSATDVYYGSTIMWSNDNSSQSNKGSAKLTDANGKDIDFVCWVSLPTGSTPTSIWDSVTAVPAFSSGLSIGRTGGADTNKPSDWSQKAKSKGAANP